MADGEGPSADGDAAAAAATSISISGVPFDLSALFNFQVLQDLLRQFKIQQDEQLELIKGLRADLTAASKLGDDSAHRLKAEIDTKASEKALTAFQLEVSRDKAAMEKKVETFENATQKTFTKHEQRLESQQSKLYDCKVALDTKAEQRTVDALTTRVDGCATAVELADTKLALKARIEEVEMATTARHDAADARLDAHGKRLDDLEAYQKTLATKEEVLGLEARMKQADEQAMREIVEVEKRGEERLMGSQHDLESRFRSAEDNLERHWSHIRNCEELVRTKADREMVQQGIDKAAADTSAVEAKYATITQEFMDKTDAWQSNAELRLDSAEVRLDEAEAAIKTKATLEETKELREKVALCALRTEMRELLEGLRQETSSRVRILKERLDRTDRELLRQLEDSQSSDRSDKFEALAAMLETKADKALTERWLEASQQLHGELQTVHVRTQTLGQGMKVVLGWVEGMADKVTGLQAGQHRMAQQFQSAREEQQFALNATARETISKVKGMLGAEPGTQQPPPTPNTGFQPSKPLASRPTSSASPRSGQGPVVLKGPSTTQVMETGSGHFVSSNSIGAPTAGGAAAPAMGGGAPVGVMPPPGSGVPSIPPSAPGSSAMSSMGGGMAYAPMTPGMQAVSAAAAVADQMASLDPSGHAGGGMVGAAHGALAGPAGAALASTVPMGGVMGRSALERLASDEPMSGPGGAGGGGARTIPEQRQRALDAKRQDLVDARMRPPSSGGPADISEPLPPHAPRTDPSKGFVRPLTPRSQNQSLELAGGPPP